MTHLTAMKRSRAEVSCKVSQFGVNVRGRVGGSTTGDGWLDALETTAAKGKSGGGGGNIRFVDGGIEKFPDAAENDLAQKSCVRSAMRERRGGWPKNIGEGARRPEYKKTFTITLRISNSLYVSLKSPAYHIWIKETFY